MSVPQRKRNATIADIARAAGVAPMTVSRVINGGSHVRPELQERVRAAITELEYSPNLLARSLKRKATRVVGLVLPDLGNPFAAEVAHGIDSVLRASGYSCFVSTVDASGANEDDVIQALCDHRVDGIIVATRPAGAGNTGLARIAARKIPLVVIGRAMEHPQVDRVSVNDRAGGAAIVHHLLELGHRRIAFIGSGPDPAAQLPRCTGYLDALREAGITPEEELLIPPASGPRPAFTTQADGYIGMQKILAMKDRPTAVFARNDYTAMGALLAAREGGISVPRDISVVGFDNVPLASFTTPPLTTVTQPIADQGREAANLLLRRINQEDAELTRIERVFECQLMVRSSTGPVHRS